MFLLLLQYGLADVDYVDADQIFVLIIDLIIIFYLYCWVPVFLLAIADGADCKWYLNFQMKIIIINF